MTTTPIIYESFEFNPQTGQGINQGQWFVRDPYSDVKVIAANNAAPCVLVFIHGADPYSNQVYAGVTHISVAERVDSLNDMISRMPICWNTAKIHLISGMSNQSSPLVNEIMTFFRECCSVQNFYIDLGKGSTQAIMCVNTGMLSKESPPAEQYPLYDLHRYFQKAVIGIMDPKRKQALVGINMREEFNPERQVILYQQPKAMSQQLFKIMTRLNLSLRSSGSNSSMTIDPDNRHKNIYSY